MTGSAVIKKVPGNLVKFDQEKDGFVDFAKLTKTELLDLNSREEKLLNRRKFCDKLPDKGEKIKKFYERIQVEIKKRQEHETLCGLLAKLNVNESKEKMDKLEWTGKYDDDSLPAEMDDENKVDPLQILATHSGTSTSKDIQVKEEKDETLVNASDIQESGDEDLSNMENFAKELCSRFDTVKNSNSKNRFYAHKSLNVTCVKDIVKNKEPEIVVPNSSENSTKEVKMLSLKESFVIQQKQKEHLKEVELMHAMEKLMNRTGISIGVPEDNMNEYREQPELVDSEDEICSVASDEDDDGEDTAVYYNLVD